MKALYIVIQGPCGQYLFDIAVEFETNLKIEEKLELSKIIDNISYNYYNNYL